MEFKVGGISSGAWREPGLRRDSRRSVRAAAAATTVTRQLGRTADGH
jgi:hypothetical protein